jgi:hypothetical protein
MSRAQSNLADMEAAYRQIEATFGGLSGVSTRAATHLQAVGTLFNASNAAMEAIESNQLQEPVETPIDLEALRTQAQLLANELVILIGKVSESRPGTARTNGVLQEMNTTVGLIRDFIRSLVRQPAIRELQQSFRLVRRQMWQLEATINQLAWPADWRRQWAKVRERANSISDEFRLPRVILLAPRVPRVAGSNYKLVAHIDRSILWLDEYVAVLGPELRKKPAGSQFKQDVAKLRRQLLDLRRRAVVNEPAEQLSQKLSDVELTNQELAGRARDLERDAQEKITVQFQNAAQAVKNVRGAMTRP